MDYNGSLIAIKGNDLQKANQLFKAFRYFDLKGDKIFSSAEEAIQYLKDNFSRMVEENDVVIRGLWADEHFTYFYDPEITDVTDEDALEDLAKKMNADIYVFIIQEASGTYEFARYTNIGQSRYFSLSGKDLFNDGSKLPEEEGINLNEKTKANDLLKLASNLNIDMEFKNISTPFLVKELGYNEDL
ncbi:MAG: hypothetical protein WC756_09915 [Taibaiella sp.]|jgi:hypothetical protein